MVETLESVEAAPVTLSLAEVDFRIAEYRRERLAVDTKREWRSGLYAVFLGAQRAGLRGSELGWLEWLSLVTIPQDDEPAGEDEEPSVGESGAPQSAS